MEKIIKISVRRLVEHVFLSGSIETGMSFLTSLAEGTKIHQQVQNTFADKSQKEVYMHTEIVNEDLHFIIDGRCDGLHINGEEITIEEIKSTSNHFIELEENSYPVHWAQAQVYAYIFAKDQKLDSINIQLTYVKKLSGEKLSFFRKRTMEDLELFMMDIIKQYTPFAKLLIRNKERRNETSRKLSFPFTAYRKGQRELAGIVYNSIRKETDLFAEAPTGIGKTISVTFPAVKAIGEGLAEKMIYLTARTTTRETAEEAFRKMESNGLKMTSVSITAKEKICFKDKTICNPVYCEFADGHYDRLNEAIMDIFEHETIITRSVIEDYAKKHRLCPFEFSLDAAYLADVIICDYNYIFDPKVSLKRLLEEQKKETVLLVDEAHNLVDRARDMFSAEIKKSLFLLIKRE